MLDSAKQTGMEALRGKLKASLVINALPESMQDVVVDLCTECYSTGYDTCKDVIHHITK